MQVMKHYGINCWNIKKQVNEMSELKHRCTGCTNRLPYQLNDELILRDILADCEVMNFVEWRRYFPGIPIN